MKRIIDVDQTKKGYERLRLDKPIKIYAEGELPCKCVNNKLKNIGKLQHTGYRSVGNFFIEYFERFGSLFFLPKKLLSKSSIQSERKK